MAEKKSTRLRRDVILIFSLLVIGIFSLVLLRLTAEEGERVAVILENTTVAEYSLGVDGEFPLLGGKNLLVIEEGRAYIKESECPDHLCERMGKISLVNERIVCLPHKLTVKII